jgi:peptide methionine sulfoxide reductase msrA/msrB
LNIKLLKINKIMHNKNFTDLEKKVMFEKHTESPFTGKYYEHNSQGVFVCNNCGRGLYWSDSKFDSGCGWPSFDQEIHFAVKRIPDADGRRIEILCNNCGIHLGHVFEGEEFTDKNIRHCVNSVSLDFVPKENIEEIVLGAGCFWGVEYYFQKLDGVLVTEVGYSGGDLDNPKYKAICYGDTGHKEVIKVTFDTRKVSVEQVLKYFFEIHNFSQTDGQGNDIGDQYLSVIFYEDDNVKEITQSIIDMLIQKGYKVATILQKFDKFWPAEDYHQNYYGKNGKLPYCHIYKKIF